MLIIGNQRDFTEGFMISEQKYFDTNEESFKSEFWVYLGGCLATENKRRGRGKFRIFYL